MDSTALYAMPSSPSFFHLLESEEDFPFGAKTTSFLHPATVTNAAAAGSPNTNTTTTTASYYDLPEWMEGREILGLPDMLEGLPLPLFNATPQSDSLAKLEEEDYISTIKPEDMLVPLSELQPPHTPASPLLANTPPASPPLANTPPVSPPCIPASLVHPVSPAPAPAPASASASPSPPLPLPKIIICRKVTSSSLKSKPIQVQFQVKPVKPEPQVTSSTPLLITAPHTPHVPDTPGNNTETLIAAMPFAPSHVEPQVSDTPRAVPQNTPNTPAVQVHQTCDAEELINEMVQMIGNDSAGLQDLENLSFDPSVIGATMDDFLAHLDTTDSSVTPMDSQPSVAPTSLPSESPSVSIPTPSPSVSIPSPNPSEFSASFLSPHPSESLPSSSPAYLPSPVPSVGSLSPAPSTSESLFSPDGASDVDCQEEWSPLEETHSYSRSQRKARSSYRSSGSRKTPYPEDRKERKKEQNKQAALRYRQKKKQEEDDLQGKIQVEEERKRKLKATYESLKQELRYQKKIMREVFIARGLLSEEALKKAAQERRKK